ncbi:MAG: UDP-N-acetylmuramoyl-L-alanyl-D-glutamate--2,6-diaminopimelate ligase [Rhodospirillales bacterium]|nr:UDP-N-acetylmuramoyl-L-alanyl-D-glutamate--2,6-diaminopimelate ligase [Rhodospirillales bacterium]
MTEAGVALRATAASVDPAIAGIAADSRQVAPGYLFAALAGARTDGRRFVADALGRGAAAVLCDISAAAEMPANVPVVAADNPRRALALLAARFYGAQPRTIAAVTGTSGKTSVVAFTRQIWTMLGHKAASLGTLGLIAPHVVRYGSLTTPDPVALHKDLADLTAAGVGHVAMEASSHGLEQFRLDGVRVAAAVFTNLSRDHLDYHGTMDAYFAAKRRLFAEVMAPGGVAVLNADAPEYETLAQLCRQRGHRLVTFGRRGADIRLTELAPTAHGQKMVFTLDGRPVEIVLPLVAAFQAMNALAALGLVVGCNADPQQATAALAKLEGVPGRLQLVAVRRNGAAIYVDYAHKPDALENVLTALRPHARRQLVVVFGCGGDRDPGKRPMMGTIAARLADKTIVTDDNPRSEDPTKIRAQILAACPGASDIGARRAAIAAAIADLGAGDVLVIAGKGHERGQIVGDIVHPFDDAETAREIVADLDGPPTDGGHA